MPRVDTGIAMEPFTKLIDVSSVVNHLRRAKPATIMSTLLTERRANSFARSALPSM